MIMPPSKVCQAVVPPRLKGCKPCEHERRAKRKAEQNLPDQATKCYKLLKTTKRATETSEQTVYRREQDKKHKASIRASETSEQTIVQYCAEGFALQCSSSFMLQNMAIYTACLFQLTLTTHRVE